MKFLYLEIAEWPFHVFWKILIPYSRYHLRRWNYLMSHSCFLEDGDPILKNFKNLFNKRIFMVSGARLSRFWKIWISKILKFPKIIFSFLKISQDFECSRFSKCSRYLVFGTPMSRDNQKCKPRHENKLGQRYVF